MTLWNPVTAPAAPPPVIDAGGNQIASSVLVQDFVNTYGPDCPVGVPTQEMIDKATQKAEERCRRPLRNAVWTHRCRIYYDGYVDAVFGAAGAVFPPAIPVQQVFTPTGTQLRDNLEVRYVPPDDVMLGFWGYTWIEMYGTVTYQGGWDNETIPEALREVICKVAFRMQARASGLEVPAPPGVESPKVGDVGATTTPLRGGFFDANDLKVLKHHRYRQA